MTTQAPLTFFSFGISSWIRYHCIFEFSVHCSHSTVWHTVMSLASGSPFILVAVFFDILTVTFGSVLAFRQDKMSLAHLIHVPPLTRSQVFLRAALMETVVWYWRCSLVLLVPAFSLGRAGKYFVFWKRKMNHEFILIFPSQWRIIRFLIFVFFTLHKRSLFLIND